MTLSTRDKIPLASRAFHLVSAYRKLRGQSLQGQFRRRSFLWKLDLREVVDFMIYLSGGFEGYLSDFIIKNTRNGDVTMDIGANIGAHTLTMGQSVGTSGKAFAIEATEYAYNKLVQNIALNPELVDVIEPIHCVLTAEGQSKEAEIYSSWPFQTSGLRHPTHQGIPKALGQARRMTLDTLIAEYQIHRLDLIKLDVDGHEWDVLSGGAQSLQALQPLIVMELAPDYNEQTEQNSFTNLHQLLKQLGYTFSDFKGRELPVETELLAATIPHGASRNVVAKPSNYQRELIF